MAEYEGGSSGKAARNRRVDGGRGKSSGRNAQPKDTATKRDRGGRTSSRSTDYSSIYDFPF